MLKRTCFLLFFLLLSQFSLSADFTESEEDFLPVDEAFPVSVDFDQGEVNLIFDNAEAYYLYKSRFKFHVEDEAGELVSNAINVDKVAYPKGIVKQDPYFGEIEAFYNQTLVTVPLNLPALQSKNISNKPLTFVYRYQGCAEAGLCYPPQTKKIEIPVALLSSDTKEGDISDVNLQSTNAQSIKSDALSIQKKNASESSWFKLSSEDVLEKLKNKSAVSLLGFFLLGILLAFTPCVLPMVPILSGIILANKSLTTARSTYLSFLYVLGMAVTYALLGVLVAYFGTRLNLQLYLQHPITLIVMACLFVVLALSMFGLFEMKLPQFIQQPLSRLNQNMEGGSAFGVFVMGAVSALIVSPCVSAPLAGILVYIASTGDVAYGAFALFVLALGMGAPLLLIGMLGPNVLPKAGAWMDLVKGVLAMLLLAVAVWLLARLIPNYAGFILWSAWLLGLIVLLYRSLKHLPAWSLLLKILAAVCLLATSTYFYQNYLPLNAQNKNTEAPMSKVYTRAALMQEIKKNSENGFASIVDVYADWCVACRVMEKEIFLNASVHDELTQVRFIKFDASDVNDLNNEVDLLFKEFDIIGLPNIMLFDKAGQELEGSRILGELHREEFLEHVKPFYK